MDASKENARKAYSELNKIQTANVPWSDKQKSEFKFIQDFLVAAERKLPEQQGAKR